ncbi:YtpR family tRNA-binding protein [Bacillus sp. DJP31]|uniref:YtpR family tRNA-binding protein n=1 Tax=Bacillus sp. DJP31 TaxID=3409789 RepID=UPI003BB7966D
MNLFYNVEGIGDTFLVTIKDADRENKTFERKGDVARIINKETSETIGYNIFNASTYMKIEEVGMVTLTRELVETIQEILTKNDFNEELIVDFSPKFVIGLVTEKEKHPNADKLNVCKVDVGNEVLQIVCGAPNVDAGQKVVVAKVGAVMPSGLHIKDAELRGVASSGMICSARELDLPDAPQEKGILVLGDEYEVGQGFSK